MVVPQSGNKRAFLRVLWVTVAMVAAPQAFGQEVPRDVPPRTPTATTIGEPSSTSPSAQSDDIVVTATKQIGVRVQDVPLAITAFGADQLARLQVRDFSDLSNAIPNVQLGGSSGSQATVNFAIRGLGTNSGIASVEPQVALYIDGVYVGQQLGALVDTFDLEGVEVLRGPQGVLFGKNATGGAVLIRTTTPTDQLFIDAQASVETGPLVSGSAVVSGPISDTLSVKVAGYYSKDSGFFDDIGTGQKAGGGVTWIARGAVRLRPSADLDVVARYEHGEFHNDTDIGYQNIPLFRGQGFDIQTSGLSYGNAVWNNATVEANLKVGFGNGTITNIAGWRGLSYSNSQDVDGRTAQLFQAYIATRQRQISDELRYTGSFGDLKATAGLYYFSQSYNYGEARTINAGPLLAGGGVLHQRTLGAFGALDWSLSKTFTLNFGARYTEERKRARSQPIVNGGCNFSTALTATYQCQFDFTGSHTWPAFIPKVGFQWKPDDHTQLYGSWTIGYRSGGYAFRRTVAGGGGGPYGPEKNYALEAGLKTDLDDGRVRINAAIFRSVVKNLQRDALQPDPNVGLIVLTSNIADAVIEGVETEATVRVADGLTLNGFVGLTDGHYTRVAGDLNGDGRVDSADVNLRLIRVVPFTFGLGATYRHDLGKLGSGIAQVNYGYKDRQAFTDNNLTFLTPQNMLNASLSLTGRGGITFALYGRNLLNRRMTDTAAVIPAALGGGIEALEKGRVLGASIRFKM